MKTIRQLSDEEQAEACQALHEAAAQRYHQTMDKINADHAEWVARNKRNDRVMMWWFLVLATAVVFLPFVAALIRRHP